MCILNKFEVILLVCLLFLKTAILPLIVKRVDQYKIMFLDIKMVLLLFIVKNTKIRDEIKILNGCGPILTIFLAILRFQSRRKLELWVI